MLRLGAIFIAVCMVLIAASLGAVLYLLFGLSGSESIIVALAVLTALALYNAVTTRLRDRSDVGGQIADLSRGTADLARQVAELGRRTAALEGQGDKLADSAAEKARAATEPLAAEIGELGTLVKQLAETVAVHELQVRQAREPARPCRSSRDPRRRRPKLAVPATPTSDPRRQARRAAAATTMIETVRGAIDANRIDLYLQPIVTLPQRKVRYYEALTRLRTEDGTRAAAGRFPRGGRSRRPDAEDRQSAAVPLRAGGAPPAAEEPRDRPVLQHRRRRR